MQIRTLCGLFVAAALLAQAPVEDRQALVAKYAALVRSDAEAIKDPARSRKRPVLESTPEFLSVSIAHERRQEVRELLLMTRLFLLEAREASVGKLPEDQANFVGGVMRSTTLELAGQIAPDSPALDLLAEVKPDFLGYLAWHASGGGFVPQTEAVAAEKAFAFYDAIIEKHPSRKVKELAMESSIELNSRPRRIAEVKQGLARLKAFNPRNPSIATWEGWLTKAELEDKVAPRAGNPVPAFQVEDLDHPGTRLSPATFRGKYWLLDFWATWCGPCKGELPFMHKAYARFHPAGLEILSISSDQKAGDIAAFRRDPEHPMPWHHAFPTGAEREKLHALFQVRGIPHMLLMGPKGQIITLDGLRGAELEKTLGKYLGSAK